jgi:integrase
MGKMGENREKQRAGNVTLDFLLDWGRQLPELIEDRERRLERLKAALNEVEAYWNQTAPWGEGFTVEKGLELLLYEAKRQRAEPYCLQPGRGRRPHCLRLTWRMCCSRHRVAYDVNAKSMPDFRQEWPVSCLSCLAPGALASSAPFGGCINLAVSIMLME